MILLSGAGRNFCGGIDLGSLQGGILAASGGCGARDAYAFRKSLGALQDAVTSLERVRCPTIALVHGACYGAGVDLITACDMRFSTADARFCVKARRAACPCFASASDVCPGSDVCLGRTRGPPRVGLPNSPTSGPRTQHRRSTWLLWPTWARCSACPPS